MPKCKSCEKPIAIATVRGGAALMQLDRDPSQDGTFTFVRGETWQATEADRKLLRPLHRPHTCGRSH